MKKLYYIVAFFFCISSILGQSLRKAELLYRDLAYTEAVAEYEKYLEKEKNPSTEVLKHAALAAYHIGNTNAAMRWFQLAYTLNNNQLSAKDIHYYLLALRGEKQYEKADELLWLYTKNDTLLNHLKTQKALLNVLSEKGEKHELKNLEINTDKADFGVAFYDKKVIFTSAKDTARDGAKTYTWNKQPYLSLYTADINTDGSFGNEKIFLKNAQTDYHNAAAAFSPNGKTVFVSVNNVNKNNRLLNSNKGTNNVQLAYGQVQGDKLINKQLVPFNSKEYSVGQPAVSADGNWLFFVSDMPGGYGGTDIYIAPIYKNGKIGTPTNLGNTINTGGNEMFPFATANALYFSSNGHYGLGGLDVFISKMDGNEFTSPQNDTDGKIFSLPENLGTPINTNRDDFAYAMSPDGTFTYLSSNREGGKGDDDIYLVLPKNNEPCVKHVTGVVTNSEDSTPIAGVLVKAYNANGNTLTEVTTDAQGAYTIALPCDESVTVVVEKPDFTKEQEVTLTGKSTLNFKMTPFTSLVTQKEGAEMIDINPIYFDFDKFYITPQGAKELDKVVFVMTKFPNMVIRIESHTDSRGEDEYNFRLSDNRAKSTYNYIINKGIDPKRIETVKGYGETQLLNKCSNNVDCTEEDHQLNRRSNFIIVRK